MSHSVVNFFILLFIYMSNGTPLRERPRLSESKYVYLAHYIPAQWGKDSEMSYHWPKGEVPYFFDSSSYDDLLKDKVRMSMVSLERDSCIRFTEQSTKPATNGSSWLHFTNKNKQRQCFHTPSYRASGEIKVILGYDCLKQGEIMHAVLHGIGFRDEVTHPQRDAFVKILWGNIRPERRIMFRIQQVELPSGLLEYDPKSIMHFHDHAFSINGQATINPLLPGLKITPSDHLSHLDKMKFGIMFGHECNRRKVSEVLDTCQGLFSGGNISGSDSLNNADPVSQNQDKIINADKKIDTSNVIIIAGHGENDENYLLDEGCSGINQGENITDDPGKENNNVDKDDKLISGNESEINKNRVVITGPDESDKTDPENNGDVSDNQGVSGTDDLNNEIISNNNEGSNPNENVIAGYEKIDPPNKVTDNRSENAQGDTDAEDADVDHNVKRQSESENNKNNAVVSASHDENEKKYYTNEGSGSDNQGENITNDPDKKDTDVGKGDKNNMRNVVIIVGHDKNANIEPPNEGESHDNEGENGSDDLDEDVADVDEGDKQKSGNESENNIKNVVVIAGHDENANEDSLNEGDGNNKEGENVRDDTDEETTDADVNDRQQSEHENNNTIRNEVFITANDKSAKVGPVNDGDASDNQRKSGKDNPNNENITKYNDSTNPNEVVIVGYEKIDPPNKDGGRVNQGKIDKQQRGSETEKDNENAIIEKNMVIDDDNIQNENEDHVDTSDNIKAGREADVIDNHGNRIENANANNDNANEENWNDSKQSNSENKNSYKIANVVIVSNSNSKIETNSKETKSNLNNKQITTGNNNKIYDNDNGVVTQDDDANIKINSEINEDFRVRAFDNSRIENQDQDENLSQDLECKDADKNKGSGHYLDAKNNDLSIDDNDKLIIR